MKIPLKLLTKIARLSPHKDYFHATLVIRGGALISYGYNHRERHSEIVALSRIWPNKRVGTTVINISISRGGKMHLSKPCKDCRLYLTQYSVSKVYYSNADGSFTMERINA